MTTASPEEKLKEALIELIKKMADEKILPEWMQQPDQMNKIISSVMDKMQEHKCELSIDDLKNAHVQKALMGLILSDEKLLNQKQLGLDCLNALNSGDKKLEENPELDKKLMSRALLSAALVQLLNPNNDKTMEMTPDQLAKSILKPVMDKLKSDPKAENEDQKKGANELEKELSDALRNLFGGDDPRQVGTQQIPVIGPIFGNVSAFEHQAAQNPTSQAFMSKEISEIFGADPLGEKSHNKAADAAMDGIISSICNDVADSISSAPKPLPPGLA
jgi:hypothetical protein